MKERKGAFGAAQPGKLVFVRTSAAQYLPPGGRGTAKRWMRNGDTLPFAMRSIQTVQTFPMYLFNEMHTDSEQIAVPHPPQCAHWGTFPPGEGIALRHPIKFQFVALLRNAKWWYPPRRKGIPSFCIMRFITRR